MTLFRSAVACAALVGSMAVLPQSASAQVNDPEAGWYVAVSGGLQNRADAEDVQGAATVFKRGFVLSGALGYRFGLIRVEGESGLTNNPNEREIVTGAFDEVGEGNISLRTYMMNAYVDLPLGGSVRPYVGGGIGMFQSRVHGLTSATLLGGIPNPEGGFFLSPTVVDTTSNFVRAYQFRVGAAFVLNDHADINAGYRFLGGDEFTIHSPTLGRLDVNGPRVHAIEIGVRAKF